MILLPCNGTNFGQSRVDQITQLLNSRTLEGEGSKDALSASPANDHESSDHQPDDEVK